jgi:hypothetical protein
VNDPRKESDHPSDADDKRRGEGVESPTAHHLVSRMADIRSALKDPA